MNFAAGRERRAATLVNGLSRRVTSTEGGEGSQSCLSLAIHLRPAATPMSQPYGRMLKAGRPRVGPTPMARSMAMRLPVATTDTSPDGFTWTREGELVMVAFTCDRDRADPHGGCGCGRAFAGLDTHMATTRAVVRDVELDLIELREVVKASLAKGGWMKDVDPLDEDAAELVAEVCAEMVEIGELFDEGTRLGRVLNDVFPVAA